MRFKSYTAPCRAFGLFIDFYPVHITECDNEAVITLCFNFRQYSISWKY